MENTLIVEIPSCAEHEGYPGNLIRVAIPDRCPECNGTRAVEMWRGLSYDGSRRLNVDCWTNACDHVDTYRIIRDGIQSGINKVVPWATPTTLEERTVTKEG
jgi:hypothetical protein